MCLTAVTLSAQCHTSTLESIQSVQTSTKANSSRNAVSLLRWATGIKLLKTDKKLRSVRLKLPNSSRRPNQYKSLNDHCVPVGVGRGFLKVWTLTSVDRIVVRMAEHPPHDGVEPRAEEERQQTDMVDRDLVATLSARRITCTTGV